MRPADPRRAPRAARPATALVASLLLAACAPRPFRIVPTGPIAPVRAAALAASPPAEAGDFLPTDLVELVALDPTIRLDIRYAGTRNFLGTAIYSSPRAFLQRPAAEAVVRVHRALAAQGYGLLIHDAYRPWYVTKVFWEATPDSLHRFVADPARGSRHNRGCAVDLTLFDRRTGRAVTMPSGYDEFTPRAFADAPAGTAAQRARRAVLRAAMEREGFTVMPDEWWHFDCRDWRRYRIGNIPVESLPPR